MPRRKSKQAKRNYAAAAAASSITPSPFGMPSYPNTRWNHRHRSSSSSSNSMEVDSQQMGSIPQTQPVSVDQVENSAGGYVFQVTDIQQLKRFICIGCESGTYYASENELTVTNILALQNLIQAGQGPEAVATIRQYSVEGRTAKQDGIQIALALCAHSNDPATKRAAYACLDEVCRIPTHLFQFVDIGQKACQPAGTGWGRAQRRAVAKWYLQFADTPKRLAYMVTKYRNRGGWTHRDLLRLCHAKTDKPLLNCLLRYCVKGIEAVRDNWPSESDSANVLAYLEAIEQLHKMDNGEEFVAAGLIEKFGLVREHVPAPLLGSKQVMAALLTNMPLTAMLRSLAKYLSSGLFTDKPDLLDTVIERITNADLLHKAMIHPINVLAAWRIVDSGRGFRGGLTWQPEPRLVTALEKAFYLSFKNVKPTGKRILLALDVSGSMSSPANPIQCISCAEAAAALAMVTVRIEPANTCQVVGFCSKLVNLNISSDDTLNSALAKTSKRNFGSTDCAQPMLWALKQRRQFDLFVVLTDNETYFGRVHPHEALVKYRNRMNLPESRLAVMAMTASKFSIADPKDPGMLDLVGFDASVPEILREFALGEF
uniref:TROVE domain-containing protein n=2 Tax=Macrostomum lignano TaxID=282301 RepID=A0A1I8GVM1_9PLAT